MGTINNINTDVDNALAVSLLLNSNNRLIRPHNPNTILNSPVEYMVVFSEPPDNRVIGCIGIEIKGPEKTYIKHLSVDVGYRCLGVATKLVKAALAKIETAYAAMHIRHDNTACLQLAENLGFMCTGTFPVKTYHIIIVERRSYKHVYVSGDTTA